jgi:hypothetical protein
VAGDHRLDAFLDLAELLGRLEEAQEVVLGVAGDRVALEALISGVGEDEDVAGRRRTAGAAPRTR